MQLLRIISFNLHRMLSAIFRGLGRFFRVGRRLFIFESVEETRRNVDVLDATHANKSKLSNMIYTLLW